MPSQKTDSALQMIQGLLDGVYRQFFFVFFIFAPDTTNQITGICKNEKKKGFLQANGLQYVEACFSLPKWPDNHSADPLEFHR